MTKTTRGLTNPAGTSSRDFVRNADWFITSQRTTSWLSTAGSRGRDTTGLSR